MPTLIIPQIEALRDRDRNLYEALRRLNNGINTVAANAGTQAVTVATPKTAGTISRLDVAAADGIFDLAIIDPNPSDDGIQYFLESSTDQSFANPRSYFLGPTRNARLMLGNLTLYWRCYSQYPGGAPSPYVYYGNPTAVVGGGVAGPAPAPAQPRGCSEIGTPLSFLPGARPQIVVEPCTNWVEIELEDGRRVNWARDTLISVFVKVQDLRPGMLVETAEGYFSKVKRAKRLRKKSWKQVVREPIHQVYYADGMRTHNRKPLPSEL